MKVTRTERTGPRPVRHFPIIIGAVATLAAAPISFPSAAEAREAAVARGQGVEDFYDSRRDQPVWFRAGQNAAAQQLYSLISTASYDGLDARDYKVKSLEKALRKAARGDPDDIRRADGMLSKAFVAYARDLRNASAGGMKFVDPRFQARSLSPRALLQMAVAAPSLTMFVSNMGWMHPSYAPLRRALVNRGYANNHERGLLRINLARARALPAAFPRYVIVNAAEQRLYMYEGGKVADSMKVVVGKQKPKDRTPMMASFVSHADLNPYWNVPPDLTAERIAPNVLEQGLHYLEKQGYQVLSDWGDNPSIVDPSTVDWQAVADARIHVRVRQLPGPANALGKVKFSFNNPFGVYLHDTPDRALLTEETRLFSGGCIRLEDAGRFGEWLFGETLRATSSDPEIEVRLQKPVPIYVTYLTAVPNGSSITYLDDVYGWDAQQLARLGSGSDHVATR
ncbi:MAG TPA: L,D-transpeptidase family protein [Sphingomicrobium sp.]|nr:L,D-transpeptidase family protein [Sphingomicrobium sp.]